MADYRIDRMIEDIYSISESLKTRHNENENLRIKLESARAVDGVSTDTIVSAMKEKRQLKADLAKAKAVIEAFKEFRKTMHSDPVDEHTLCEECNPAWKNILKALADWEKGQEPVSKSQAKRLIIQKDAESTQDKD